MRHELWNDSARHLGVVAATPLNDWRGSPAMLMKDSAIIWLAPAESWLTMKSSWQTDTGILQCRWSDLGQRTSRLGCKNRQTFKAVICRPSRILPATVHLEELPGSICIVLITTPNWFASRIVRNAFRHGSTGCLLRA